MDVPQIPAEAELPEVIEALNELITAVVHMGSYLAKQQEREGRQ